MRVILMQDILHTGKRGEVLDVKPGYARNFLLPQGLALEATPGNMEVFEQQRRKIELKHQQSRDEALEVAARLQGLTVEVAKRASEGETLYGSVTAAEIGEALVRKGISIDNRRIDLEGGIKTLGEHPVRIGLHSDVIAEITVNVVAEEE
jgi:large subunit ribosomal protein L9